VRNDLPTGTVTFLFTDVEGSTRLMHELGEEAYAAALAEHRRLIRAACASAGGIEVDTQGDAFFFAFPTAPGALAAASAFTEGLASGPIRVRVGLHTGTPLLTEERERDDVDARRGCRPRPRTRRARCVAIARRVASPLLVDIGGLARTEARYLRAPSGRSRL
jgi:Adenylate and Guanylate cyclase catalytic domain